MSKAKITLLGFYKWDNTLFDNIELTPLINKDTLINNILLECGEFEVLYGNPIFYKNAVNHFFKLNYDLFNRWAKDLQREYDPLENYDRKESWSEKAKNVGNENETNSNSFTNKTNSSGNNVTMNDISSFDSSSLVLDNKTTSTDSYNNNENGNGNSTRTNNKTDNNELQHEGRLHGNIGVTTSQQMLESELLLRQKWQLIKMITDLFMNDLTIPVYE